MARYAADTAVPADRSRAEIEATLRRYGAKGFAYGWTEESAVVGFKIHQRQIRFELKLPNPQAREFTHTPGKGLQRSDKAAADAWEQACRQRWRALALVIKAKLEAIDAGISTFDDEFLAHLVLPGGATVGQVIGAQLPELMAGGDLPALLPGGH